MIYEPMYTPRGRAREYGDLAINIYTGCNHGCAYCWARDMKERFTPKGRPCMFDMPEPRRDIVEIVKRQLSRERTTGKLVHLCFSCDPYPAEIDTTPTREIIEALKNAGNHVQILTKGGARALRDLELLNENDWFGVSFASYKKSATEPGAAPVLDRLFTIEKAKRAGVKTWISCEPVLSEDDIFHLIGGSQFAPSVDVFKIGMLNYHTPEEYGYAKIDWAAFGREVERLCIDLGRGFYIKNDLRQAMVEGSAGGGRYDA